MGMISFVHEGTTLAAFDSENGSGPAVLTVHGGLADHRSGLRLVEPLGGQFRVVAPDLRGAGQSLFSGALSWTTMAADLVALLDRLEIDRAVVAGTSMGSGVALRFALDAPGRCAGLVLVSPMYPGSRHSLAPAQLEALGRMDALAQRAVSEGIEALLPIYDALPPPLRDRAVTMARSFDPRSVATTTAFLLSGAQPFDSLEDLRAVGMPTMLVPGVDPQHPREVADACARAIPDVRVCELADYGSALPAFVAALRPVVRLSSP